MCCCLWLRAALHLARAKKKVSETTSEKGHSPMAHSYEFLLYSASKFARGDGITFKCGLKGKVRFVGC